MSAAIHQLFAVVEQAADPFAIPPPPFLFVEMRDRIATYAVLSGSTRIGTVRHDADSGLFVARTNGSSEAAADIQRNFASREKAAEWLARAIDGIQPRKAYKRYRTYGKKTLAAAGLALLLATPALADVPQRDSPQRTDPAYVGGVIAGGSAAAVVLGGYWLCWMLPVWIPALVRRRRTTPRAVSDSRSRTGAQ